MGLLQVIKKIAANKITVNKNRILVLINIKPPKNSYSALYACKFLIKFYVEIEQAGMLYKKTYNNCRI